VFTSSQTVAKIPVAMELELEASTPRLPRVTKSSGVEVCYQRSVIECTTNEYKQISHRGHRGSVGCSKHSSEPHALARDARNTMLGEFKSGARP
jgi:hypothetical protein